MKHLPSLGLSLALALAPWGGCVGTWDPGGGGPRPDDDDSAPAGDDDFIGEQVPGAGEDPAPEVPPLCHIELWCDELRDEPKLPCRLSIAEEDGAVLVDGWAGVERRGRSSNGFAKPHLSVELWEDGRTLVDVGSTWRYLDTGVDPGGGWTSPSFDDAAWALGAAPLGYGGEEATEISYGSDPDARHVTAWFRHLFSVSDTATAGPLTLALRRDDGAVAYLNGVEVARSNMPGGSVTAQTLAAGTTAGVYEDRYFEAQVDPSLLVAGDNVLAVEVHQVSQSSSDALMDAWLGDVGQPRSVDLYGMGGESDWIINGNYLDRSLLRNKLSFDVARSFEDPASYAPELVLCEATIDGAWAGVFTLGERIKRDDDRVDLAEDPDDAGGSFIVKLDDGGGGLVTAASTYGEWFPVYPRPEELSDTAAAGIRAALQAMEDAATGPYAADPDIGALSHFDLDSAVDWVLMQELSKNNDAYFLSIYLTRDLGGPLRFVLWDHDLAWGDYPVGACEAQGWVGYRPALIQAFAATPGFRERLVERWLELRGGPLAAEVLLDRVATYRAVMGDDAYRNFDVWPMEEIEFSWDGIDHLCPVSSFDEGMDLLEDWIVDRLAWMDENIDQY